MPSQLLGRRWLAITIWTLVSLGSVVQEDGMAQNRQVLNFYPGIVAMQLRQLLPTLPTIAVIQAAF